MKHHHLQPLEEAVTQGLCKPHEVQPKSGGDGGPPTPRGWCPPWAFTVGRHPHPITISWLGRGHSGLKRHIDVQAGFSWAQSGVTEYPRPQPDQHFTGKSLFSIFHDPFPDLFHGCSSRVQRDDFPPLGLPPGVGPAGSPQESASPSLLALIGLPAYRHFSRCFTLNGLTPESIHLRRGRLNPHLLVGVFWAVTIVDCGKCPGSSPNKPPVFPHQRQWVYGCRVPHRHLLPPIGLLTPSSGWPAWVLWAFASCSPRRPGSAGRPRSSLRSPASWTVEALGILSELWYRGRCSSTALLLFKLTFHVELQLSSGPSLIGRLLLPSSARRRCNTDMAHTVAARLGLITLGYECAGCRVLRCNLFWLEPLTWAKSVYQAASRRTTLLATGQQKVKLYSLVQHRWYE